MFLSYRLFVAPKPGILCASSGLSRIFDASTEPEEYGAWLRNEYESHRMMSDASGRHYDRAAAPIGATITVWNASVSADWASLVRADGNHNHDDAARSYIAHDDLAALRGFVGDMATRATSTHLPELRLVAGELLAGELDAFTAEYEGRAGT